jgi:hypothetical protein
MQVAQSPTTAETLLGPEDPALISIINVSVDAL